MSNQCWGYLWEKSCVFLFEYKIFKSEYTIYHIDLNIRQTKLQMTEESITNPAPGGMSVLFWNESHSAEKTAASLQSLKSSATRALFSTTNIVHKARLTPNVAVWGKTQYFPSIFNETPCARSGWQSRFPEIWQKREHSEPQDSTSHNRSSYSHLKVLLQNSFFFCVCSLYPLWSRVVWDGVSPSFSPPLALLWVLLASSQEGHIQTTDIRCLLLLLMYIGG